MTELRSDELDLMYGAMVNGISATPPDYFEAEIGLPWAEAHQRITDSFERVRHSPISPELLDKVLGCMRMSVMFVADFEYHARTGFDKDDVLAFLVAMETTGRPPERYPMNLK